jgi:fatty-acyl-CoA synthase
LPVEPATAGVADAFYLQREKRPNATFLRYQDQHWTYAETAAQSHALACALQELGLEKGDRIALHMPNWPELVLSVIAASEIGATIVPINPAYSPPELRFVLRNTEATVVITAERYGGIEYLELFESLFSELPSLQYLVTVGEEDLWYDDRIFQFEDLVSAGRGHVLQPVEVGEDDPMAILYTAGTATDQKGVVLSHSNLLRTARGTAGVLRVTEEDLTLCTVPLFNIFGLGVALLTTIVTGSSILLQESFDSAHALELVDTHRPTVLHGVPTMFVMLRRDPALAETDLGSLRTGIIAGAPVSPELIRWLRAEAVPDLEIAYGLTETSSTVAMTSPDLAEAGRSETVGKPIDGVEVAIIDEREAALPDGTEGEVAVRGFNVMQGYFRQPAATQAALTSDGYLKTGDLGMIDAEGYLRIVGRKRDLIIRGGYSVHPREVEDHLRSLPAVADAMVVGIPNEVLGELVCACVIPVEGARDSRSTSCRTSFTSWTSCRRPRAAARAAQSSPARCGSSWRAVTKNRPDDSSWRDSSHHPLRHRAGGEIEGPLARPMAGSAS